MIAVRPPRPHKGERAVGIGRIAALLVAVMLTGCAAGLDEDPRPDLDIPRALGLERLPASASRAECVGAGFTDTIDRCAFTIAPEDFEQLIAGRPFAGGRASGASSNANAGPLAVGTDFPIAASYEWDPPGPEKVQVLTDAARRHVLVIRVMT